MASRDYSEAGSGAGASTAAATGGEQAVPEFVDDGDIPLSATDVPGVLTVSAQGAGGERLDRFLAKALAGRLQGVSRSRIQKWIALGAVECAQRPVGASTRLAGFETLSVAPLPREADKAFAPDPVELAIVDEDEEILVVDKPAGLVVHPAPGNWRNTMLNGLLYLRAGQAELPRAGIVHRLDKDTSGLMVVAKTERAVSALVAQLADRTMSRRYLAFVAGEAPPSIEIDAPIGRDPRSRVRMAVVRGAAGREARTGVSRIATLRIEGAVVSLVECRLETGRTHQIRVHLKHIGHPLLGDATYGGPAAGISRQALHAWRLGLHDPVDARARRWVSVPPADMRALAESANLDFTALCADLDGRIRN